uniref:Uncharacterized protein n=1 Tax=Myoviridae sp. ctrMq22 TaxID=2825181 RepID=A0A8S5NWD3_9CAUD|nr:MAG TPA: hypothetical protein [Myoviridae sp. ctrMq22]
MYTEAQKPPLPKEPTENNALEPLGSSCVATT